MKPIFIAEVKVRSPFGFRSSRSWNELFDIAEEKGDMISIHTNPLWGGDMKDIREARKRTKKPILAKGIHPTNDDIREALDNGADKVLVVGRLPHHKLADKCFIEPADYLQFLEFAVTQDRLVWNSRDLNTGKERFEEWADIRPLCSEVIQASNIKSMKDVYPDAYAFIVGENLPTFK